MHPVFEYSSLVWDPPSTSEMNFTKYRNWVDTPKFGLKIEIFLAYRLFIPRHTKSGRVLCYTLRTLSVRPSVCPPALRFRALTLVPFDLFSSNFAQTLVSGRSDMGLQVG